MSSNLLTECRCTCGKLLFKGLLCQCIVEVKCRRCGAMTTWGITDAHPYVLVESDADACMTATHGDTENILGCDRDYLIGRPIAELFPVLRDAPERSGTPEKTYELSNMMLTLRDGREQQVESCVVPRYRDGAFSGYRVFAVPKGVANA